MSRKGQFPPGQSGNPAGRPKNPEAEILRKALESAKKEKGLHLIDHAVNAAYTSEALCIAILKKILPDKMSDEMEEFSRLIFARALKNDPNSRHDKTGQG